MKMASSKISQLIVTLFLGAIMVAFILTGFEGFSGSSDAVATVDGTPVKIGEYRRALDSQISRFSQMFGGKSLTNQQIRQFGIKQNVLNSLVQQKMMLNFAKDELKVSPSIEEIKEEIKNSPFFQTNKKFDVTRYRALLSRNGYTPAKYEELVIDQIRGQKLNKVLTSFSPSAVYAKEILEFKNEKAKVMAISFNKEDMTKQLTITSEEIKKFANDKSNTAKLEALYKAAGDEFNKPAKVKARHILLKTEGKDEKAVKAKAMALRAKLNTKNFKKIASKETEDNSGKSNGGDLGEFAKGRMVPEFEAVAFTLKPGKISTPVKTKFGYHIIYVEKKIKADIKPLARVKNTLAKRHLQKTKRKELDAFNNKLKADLKSLLAKGNSAKIKSLSKKYNFTFQNLVDVNVFDLAVPGIEFDKSKLSAILMAKNTNEVLEEENATKISLLRAKSFVTTKFTEANINAEIKAIKGQMDTSVGDNIIKGLQAKSKVVTYPNLL